MKNKKLIESLLLKTIEENDGYCDWNTLQSKIKAHFFAYKVIPIPTNRQLVHLLSLLEGDIAVERIVELPVISYRLTSWGHAKLGPWYKRWGYFLIYKNNNLIAFIALIISILSLISPDKFLKFFAN